MDQALVDVFEQARKVVADADRKIAEEDELAVGNRVGACAGAGQAMPRA